MFLQSAALLAADPAITFPKAKRERLALTSYPFRAFIDSSRNQARDQSKPGFSLLEFPRIAKQRFGIENINPVADHLAATDAAYLERLRRAIIDAGSHIVDLGVNAGSFASADPAEQASAIATGRQWVDIAKQLGSPSMRQHLKAKHGEPPSSTAAAQSLARLSDYAAQQNIVINLENDSPGAEDPFFLLEVLDKVASPYLRGLPDFGNSLRGHDNAYNRRAVSGMFDHAWNMCHVKNVLADHSGQTAHVDLPPLFAIARDHHYAGYFSMEFDTAEGDPFTGTQNLIDLTLRYM